jgi:hypothetical protein
MTKYLVFIFAIFCLGNEIISAQNFQWLKSLGGNDVDVTRGVCIDNSGNIYITGTFQSTTVINGITYNSNGATDIFIVKMNAAGNYLWIRTFGSSSFDYVFDIDNDINGNIAITGAFRNTMVLPGGLSITSAASADEFTAKLDTNGNCIWAKTGSGATFDMGNEINITPQGNILTIGNTEGNITFDGNTLTHIDNTDVFFAKYNPSGIFQTAKLFGGIGTAQGRAISSDENENILIAGVFTGQMTIGTNTLNSSNTNDEDCFVAKLDPNGNAIWVKQYGSSIGSDYARGIDADAQGNIYVSGVFSGTVNFDGNVLTANGTSDIFLLKYNSVGNIIWIKQIGGNFSDEGCEIEVKDNGDVFATGQYSQTIVLNGNNFNALGARDVFISKMNSDGDFIWNKTLGGPQDDVNYAIGLNRINEELVTVGTYSSSFTDGLTTINSNGNVDSYISKISAPELSIPSFDDNNKLIVYPNPSNQILNVNCNNGFHIYSKLGQLIEKSLVSTKIIDISKFAKGVYILKSENKTSIFIKN